MAVEKKKTPRLGRGLSSLMATPAAVDQPVTPPSSPAAKQGKKIEATPPAAQSNQKIAVSESVEASIAAQAEGLIYVAVANIEPNPSQPRQHFGEAALKALAQSIKQDGLMQPIVVRPKRGSSQGGASRYESVAGERRWRAAQIASIDTLPAVVRDIDDAQSAAWALVENLQREDLNPIERAEAFQQLADRFGLTTPQIAERVGLDRSSVANMLRLNALSLDVKPMVRDGLLSMGQARALLGISDPLTQLKLAERVVKEAMSVRAVEEAVKSLQADDASSTPPTPATRKTQKPAHLADLEKHLVQALGTRVTIRPGRKKGSGKMTIDFYSLDEFDALLERLGVEAI